MGTRAIILLEAGSSGIYPIGLYKHWDGHPGYTLPKLTALLEELKGKRYFEPDIYLANIVQSFLNYRDAESDPKYSEKFGRDVLGYRVCTVLEMKKMEDIEVSYLVTRKGGIDVSYGNVLWKKPKTSLVKGA